MIEYSQKLSEDFKLVRVDFYEINGALYLGELTFTPGSGFFKFKDDSYSLLFGDMLDLEINKKRPVIYTCITNGYDSLLEPDIISPYFDYICFTDMPIGKHTIWEIRPIPEELKNLSYVKQQRYIKVNAHKVLPEYDLSVWVDANVTLRNNILTYIKQNCNNSGYIFIGEHPQRKCTYEEAKTVVRLKKDIPENINPQIERYKEEGFPVDYGMYQTCIMIRHHNNPECIKLMEKWWDEIEKGSHRDQLSLLYAQWKTNTKIEPLDKSIFNNEYFKWGGGHRKVPTTKNTPSTQTNVSSALSTLKDTAKEILKPKNKPISHLRVNRNAFGAWWNNLM